MESTFLFLAVCLMFSGVRGVSQSMSCSTVNGKTICDRQTSQGGSAMASSMSSTGMGPDYQSTYAGAGDRGQWDSSSQTVYGGSPGNPSSSYGYPNAQQAPSGAYGGPMGGVSSFSSSGAAPSLGYVGGPPGAYAGGFAAAGSFPFSIFPGSGYPPQGSSSSSSSSSSSGGAPSQGPSNAAPPPPIAAGPMAFVNGFMGGGFAGAGAYAGAFPFGRR